MQIWFKGSLLLAATLSAGIALGIWYERWHAPVGTATQTNHAHIMQRLEHSLHLEPQQAAIIHETLRKHQVLVDSVWQTLRPHVAATLDSTHREIMNALHPSQREAFQKLAQQVHHGGRH